LRLWLRAGHIDPDEDVKLAVIPPPFMVETLRQGQLDAFCVGAPWNTLAVTAGAGTILHQGTDIVRDCPEKVLAFRADWARSHKKDVIALAEAVGDASRWAAAPSNHVALLTRTAGQNVTAATIEEILEIPAFPSGPAQAATGLRLDEDAINADPAQALWLYAQMVAAGQTTYSDARAKAAAAVYGRKRGNTAPRTLAQGFGPENSRHVERGLLNSRQRVSRLWRDAIRPDRHKTRGVLVLWREHAHHLHSVLSRDRSRHACHPWRSAIQHWIGRRALRGADLCPRLFHVAWQSCYIPAYPGLLSGPCRACGRRRRHDRQIGGFVLPIAFGALNDLTGLWTSCFMLLFLVTAANLLWMHAAILRMERASVVATDRRLEQRVEVRTAT